MPDYKSPGVYVEEVASGSAPIAGVGTSTAGFIAAIGKVTGEEVGQGNGETSQECPLANNPVLTDSGTFTVTKKNRWQTNDITSNAELENRGNESYVKLSAVVETTQTILVDYHKDRDTYPIDIEPVTGEEVATEPVTNTEFPLVNYPVETKDGTFQVSVINSEDNSVEEQAKHYLENREKESLLVYEAEKTLVEGEKLVVDYQKILRWSVPRNEVKLCTNFSEFTNFFGNFSEDPEQNRLAHAVYGFFNNGGTRCYVVWIDSESNIDSALTKFEAIDEIAIVAAPGITDKATLDKINTHCQNMGDRFAILDSPEEVGDDGNLDVTKFTPGDAQIQPGNNDYAAYYFPWIQVYDPASQTNKYVPPSGHMAGLYARVDTQRGVHKSPANEVIQGALDLKYKISKNHQDGLNPQGINCIRNLNGNIRVWGARTLGGDANLEWKYINARRLFLYLRESIDEGTQWVVFEPNSPALWAQIRRNITAFLTNVWRSGALFGTTPEQAFFVKCDEETNPPEVRDQGQVVTEIGVAVVKPAEFVIFRISQWAGPGSN